MAEPLAPRGRRDDDVDRRQERPTGVVEVVAVVIVREQHGVDRQERGGGNGWAGQLLRVGAPAEVVRLAGRVEGRVGQEPPALDLDQGGRAADVRDADRAQAVARAATACSSAHSRA